MHIIDSKAKKLAVVVAGSIFSFLSLYGVASAAISQFSSVQVGASPTNGFVLQTNGSASTWVATSTLGLGGSGGGSVTSVAASGGTTGLTFSGSPITSSGTLTLAGTLIVANGGTGSTTLSGLLKGNGTGSVLSAVANTDYQSPITLTTTGSSGASTFNGTTLNIPQYAGTTYTATYPVTLTGSAFGLAFGTSTSNTWGGTQTFSSNPILGSLSGIIYGNSGVLAARATTTVSCSGSVSCSTFDVLGSSPVTITGSGGGTAGLSTSSPIASSNLLVYSAAGAGSAYGVATTTLAGTGVLTISNSPVLLGASPAVASITGGSGGQVLGWASGVPTWLATTTFSSPLLYSAGNVTCQTATGSVPGCLSAADWTTFNGKQAAGNYITALTGDVTASGPGSVAATLATVNSNVGSFTNANITVNAKGLITAASNGSAGGSAFPFTPATSWGVNTSATTTALFGQASIFASSTSATVPALSASNTTGPAAIFGQGNVGLGTTTPWATLSVNAAAQSNPYLAIGSSTSQVLSVTPNASAVFSLGTTSTAAALNVGGNVRIAATAAGGTNGTLTLDGLAAAAGTFVAADPTGKLIATTTPGGGALATTTTIGSFPAWQIGKQKQIFTSTGTSTFSVPSGITQVDVEVQAGGGGGGSNGTGSGGAGGAGGYATKIVDVTGTSTIQVFVGSGGAGTGGAGTGGNGTWSTFGTNGSYLSASGGSGGAQAGAGGVGGVGTGGDINIGGQDGGLGLTTSSGICGSGGTSHFGGGGAGGNNGNASALYGGGGGCGKASGAAGAGAQGIVIVRW